MHFHIPAKERGIGKSQLHTNLLDAHVGVQETIADVLNHIIAYPFIGRFARMGFANSGEVFGSDTQFLGKMLHWQVLHGTVAQQVDELLENRV